VRIQKIKISEGIGSFPTAYNVLRRGLSWRNPIFRNRRVYVCCKYYNV